MQIFNLTSNFLENSARIIHQNSLGKSFEQSLIIVPEKFYISPLKTAFASIIQTGEIPQIISIEGLSQDESKTKNTEKKNTLSRNQFYSKVFEFASQEIPNEQDSSAFARATIGEIPSLYNHNITPDEIFSKIPANIPTAKEINLHLFVKIWTKLNHWLKTTQTNTYFSTPKEMLENAIHNCTGQIYIFHNFERSPLINNTIKRLSDNKNTTIFVQNYQKSHPCFKSIHKFEITTNEEKYNKIKKNKFFHVHSKESEEKTILNLTINFLKSQQEKIAIICQDENLGQKISFELSSHNISHQYNFSTPIESNPLIKSFLAILECKHEKLLPTLQISNIEKKYIISSIVHKKPNQNTFWHSICNLIPKYQKLTQSLVEAIFRFIEQNKHQFYTNKTTIPIFLQFKNFILNEIQSSPAISKHTILHIANSWKIWEEKSSTNIKICNLRTISIQKFDSIILSSAFETTPTGNAIFSEGMRIYYGFSPPNSTNTILSTINEPIFFTGANCPFESSILELECEETPSKTHKTSSFPIKIKPEETPSRLSATQIETLFTNPLKFYYQYIKNLQEIPYKRQKSSEIGNFIHKLLEDSTIHIQQEKSFNFKEYILKSFSDSKFYGIEVFYIQKLLEILTEVSQTDAKISVEVKDIQTQVECCKYNFTITAKSDRIDKTIDTITIFDYKTGIIKDYDKKIKKNEKIQALIPALFFCETPMQMIGTYISLEHSNPLDIQFEITQEILETFVEKFKIYAEKYFINHTEIPRDNKSTLYSYFHVARN